jgi:hypothetical protein
MFHVGMERTPIDYLFLKVLELENLRLNALFVQIDMRIIPISRGVCVYNGSSLRYELVESYELHIWMTKLRDYQYLTTSVLRVKAYF